MNRRCDGVFSEIRPKSSETGLFVHERPGWFRHRCSFSTRTAQPRPCADSLPGLLWLWRSWLSPWLRSFPEWVPYIASAAVTNSFSTLGTVSYDAGSCGVDSTAGVVTSPGIKRIVKVSNNEIYVVGVFLNFAGDATADYVAKWNGLVGRGWAPLETSTPIASPVPGRRLIILTTLAPCPPSTWPSPSWVSP